MNYEFSSVYTYFQILWIIITNFAFFQHVKFSKSVLVIFLIHFATKFSQTSLQGNLFFQQLITFPNYLVETILLNMIQFYQQVLYLFTS